MLASPPLDRWPSLRGCALAPLAGGLINATWRVGEPPRAVLQRLNPIFRPELHGDIEAVTQHLRRKGFVTPTLLRTVDGDLCHVDVDGACWRALSWVDGRSHERLQSPALAAEAGDLVGRWHRATADLRHDFASRRPGAHDTHAHMAALQAALARQDTHRLIRDVRPVAAGILDGWDRWEGVLGGPSRIAHGDLKISNLRFDEEGHGICLLDLDTLAQLPLDIELGDAWRSWCNPAGEDTRDAAFERALFEPSARAYLRANPIEAPVRSGLVVGIERICLELASRFCADALRERYFGWDPKRFGSRGEHNLLRAAGQLSLARSVRAQRPDLERVLR